MRQRVVIIGNYGAKNIGDEAVLAGILELLQTAGLPRTSLTVLSYDPADTQLRHNVSALPLLPFGIRSFFRRAWWKSIGALRKADLVLVGGGSLFTDEKMQAMWLWYFHVRVAVWLCPKVGLFANGIGPVKTKRGRQILQKVLQLTQFITLRDKDSYNFVKKLSPSFTKIYLTADPAFILNKNFDQKKKQQIVISLRPWLFSLEKTLESLASFCDDITSKGYKVVLLSMQTFQDDDRSTLRKLYEIVLNKKSVQLISQELSLDEVQKIIGESECVIGMRLHSLILGILEQTPSIALGYSQKVHSLMTEAGMGDYYLDISEVTLEQLLQKWSQLQENRERLQALLESVYPVFRSRALDNLKAIQDFLQNTR